MVTSDWSRRVSAGGDTYWARQGEPGIIVREGWRWRATVLGCGTKYFFRLARAMRWAESEAGLDPC